MLSKEIPNPARIKDLPDILGGSVNYWYGQVAANAVPHYRIGKHIYFTLKDIEQIRKSLRVQPVTPDVRLVGGPTQRSRSRHANRKLAPK